MPAWNSRTRRRPARSALAAVVATAALATVVGVPGTAAAATSAQTCAHLHGRLSCVAASIRLSRSTFAAAGGTLAISYTSSGSTTCSLRATPSFWTGRNPTPVRCRGVYRITVPATVNARRWTFRLVARNRARQQVAVQIALTQQAVPQPVIYTSSNWSGYVLEGTHIAQAQGTFNVPTLTQQPANGDASTVEWVGIDGFSNSDLIQAGVSEDYDATSNTMSVYPWWEILPNYETPITTMTVAPGDRVTVTIAQLSGSNWGIGVTDDTTGQSFATQQTYTGAGTSAEWIVEAPQVNGALAQLGDYSPNVTFSGLAANGARAAVDELFMLQNDSIVSSPSALDANGFSVAYGPNPPPAP